MFTSSEAKAQPAGTCTQYYIKAEERAAQYEVLACRSQAPRGAMTRGNVGLVMSVKFLHNFRPGLKAVRSGARAYLV